MVLFASVEKRDKPIREIPFHRGLNIVWGVELPDDAGINKAHPVTLAGHSVGKTTLCRLIRYCLGESTFGNPGAMARIKNTFPEGWIGIDLIADGQEWSVLKPFGRSGDPKAAQGIKIEELFDLERENNHFSAYMEHLSTAMMRGLQSNFPPSSEKPYEWKHLLAWLTRDQEARFQSLHDWRSPRSASDMPRFERPKEHALYLIRLVLDLLQDEERDVTRKLSADEKDLMQLETRIRELRQEPEFRFNEQERALRQLIGLPSGAMLHADESDLASPVNIRRSELEGIISTSQGEIEVIDRRIAQKRMWLASYDEQRRRFRDVIAATDEATEQPEGGVPEDDTVQKLRALSGKDCTYGNVPFSECSYVRMRLAEADKVINLQQVREDRRVVSETERRLSILEQQRQDHDQVAALLEELRKKLDKDIAEKRAKERDLAEQRAELQRLNYHLEQRKLAMEMVEGRTLNTPLERETARANELGQTIDRQNQEIQHLQATYKQRLKAIGDVYDSLIKGALSDSYSGALRMPKGELQFHIEEATGLSGEAVETLALVLADVAAMICSCRGIGYHPRFLLHDSPREADLDRHIYNRYLRAMMALTIENGGMEEAPFQYIVTTTSRPPEDLHNAICLKLEAHPQENMLFRCVLRNPELPTVADLFDAQGEK